jgi:hypothetical protein
LANFATACDKELNGIPSIGIETYRKVKIVGSSIYAGASVGNVALGKNLLSSIEAIERVVIFILTLPTVQV